MPSEILRPLLFMCPLAAEPYGGCIHLSHQSRQIRNELLLPRNQSSLPLHHILELFCQGPLVRCQGLDLRKPPLARGHANGGLWRWPCWAISSKSLHWRDKDLCMEQHKDLKICPSIPQLDPDRPTNNHWTWEFTTDSVFVLPFSNCALAPFGRKEVSLKGQNKIVGRRIMTTSWNTPRASKNTALVLSTGMANSLLVWGHLRRQHAIIHNLQLNRAY